MLSFIELLTESSGDQVTGSWGPLSKLDVLADTPRTPLRQQITTGANIYSLIGEEGWLLFSWDAADSANKHFYKVLDAVSPWNYIVAVAS
jgi:hypothetical protein